ncbi:ABC transporter ATP-binding protein [Schlesneria paludicola]|uniref:ABC transporter ATP-binding protein n=1 Tax=Schlesneria paludicola TaxID=360056 RepID=UPI00029A074B|nr:ABC transporter ATP-binding protein [Schlesneria paludicola]
MTNLIELVDVTKDYGRFRALDHVSLQIRSGVTGLLGPNGAGKSTLIKVLLGLVRMTSGRGRLLEFELGRQSREIREQVGYMPEDDCYLHGMTGVESVQFVAQLAKFPAVEGLRRAHEILDFCGVAQERYRTVETYSTGMRQKLRFAQALVHDPPVLILDEPTSGLDPEERQAMLNRIRVMAREHHKAVLLCTHILPDVQSISDSVVILARGRVQVAEDLAELSRPSSPSLHVRLLGSSESFVAHLHSHGIPVEVLSTGIIALKGPPDELARLVWLAAEKCHVSIRSLTPARNSLEEIFVNAVREEALDE